MSVCLVMGDTNSDHLVKVSLLSDGHCWVLPLSVYYRDSCKGDFLIVRVSWHSAIRKSSFINMNSRFLILFNGL